MQPNWSTFAIRERVEEGFKFLNERYGPEWPNRIDSGTLNIECGVDCLLGQLEGDFHHGITVLGITPRRAGLMGFDVLSGDQAARALEYGALTGEWKRRLEKFRESRVPTPAPPVFEPTFEMDEEPVLV